MKNNLSAIIAVSMVLIFSCAPSKKIESRNWTGNQESMLDSIPLTDYSYDDKSKVFYQVYNDRKNIYLLIKIADEPSQRMFMGRGITVWIDPSAGKGEKYGIRYPIGGFGGRRMGREGFQRGSSQQQEPELNLNPEMVLTGLGEGVGTEQVEESNNPNYIHVRMFFDKYRTLNYRLVIPVKVIESKEKFKEDKFFSLGIVSQSTNQGGGREGGYRPEGREPGEGNGGEGMGTRGGRGMGRGGYGGNQDFRQMESPLNIWLKNIELSGKVQ